ncbi:MAG: DUF4349 domain-containing protein [Actinomycetota bacterium]|nr:DUF4349 domain-containing protein [Actinomycetota bacterium]
MSVVLLALVAASCSADDSAETFREVSAGLDSGGDSATTAATFAASGAVEDENSAPDETEEPAADDSDDLGSGGVSPVAFQPADLGRDIIFTADLTVAVNDVASAGDQATREIQSLGGFLFGQRTTGSPEPRSTLIFKVQPEDFSEALDRLGDIGDVRSQNVSADDVTERIVNLESRIATAVASVERLRALLSEATDIKEVVALESELLTRETDLESLRGSLRTLQDQVTLATIVLTLTEAASRPEMGVDVSAYPAHDGGLSCPGSSDIVVEQDTEATMCLEIVNVGDTWLSNFEVRDPVLDIDLADMIVVFGDPTKPIEPGESILLAYEVTPSRDLHTRTTVTAQPVDEDGQDVPGRPASTTIGMFIGADDPGGIPTFSEGLDASWNLLVSLGQLLVLIAGALIPFVWVPVIVFFGWRLWQGRGGETTRKEEEEETAASASAT